MGAAELLLPTVRALGALFAGGGALVLALSRFDLRRLLGGELGARYLGWALLVPLYLLALFAGGPLGLALLATAIAVGLWEYGVTMRLARREVALLGALAVGTVAIALGRPALLGPLPTVVLLGLTLLPLLRNEPGALHGRVWPLFGGYLYVAWALAHALRLWALPGGHGLLLVLLAGCGLADIGAYCIGKAIGRRPIAPRISPNKCWEGLIGNALGAGLALALFAFALPPLGAGRLLALGALVTLGSAWGDLLSSLLKRRAGVKDWGTLLPGHGGLLDRLNSLIVVLPLVTWFLLATGWES